MPTDSALQALSILRNGSLFQWYVIPLFVLAVYVYAVEIERQSWSMLFAGLAFWGMDWFPDLERSRFSFHQLCASMGRTRGNGLSDPDRIPALLPGFILGL